MSMKILSLSLILVIANFMYGMTTQEKAFYTKELNKAQQDFEKNSSAVGRLTYKYIETNIGQIYRQKWQEYQKCEIDQKYQLSLDCKTTKDAFNKAREDFYGSEEYEKTIAPVSNESYFHLLKTKKLNRLLSGSDLEVIIEDLEKKSKKLANNKNQIRRIRRAKTNDRVAQYFRYLAGERIESTIPQYH